ETMRHALIGAARQRPSEDPIFAIHGEALRRAAAGEDVIDASLGTLMDEDGKLSVMPTVIETLRKVDPTRAAAYAPISGEKCFNDAVIADVFGPAGLVDQASCVATAGGTGAVHHAVVNFLDLGEKLLTTDFHWGPYGTIADQSGRGVKTFPMFDENHGFNLPALKSALEELAKTQSRILLILNFPCHNPTGYSLSDAEWRGVVDILKEVDQGIPVALLLDMAYARYGAPGTDAWVKYVGELTDRMPVMAAWSASKTFAQYGARTGGLAVALADGEERKRIEAALSYTGRGTWSNCNHSMMLAAADLLTDPKLRERVEADRAALLDMLGERVEIFNEEAKAAGIQYPRYEGGFFVIVFSSDPKETARRCNAEGLFVVPINGAVRIALCATPKPVVKRMVEILARGVAGLQGDAACR
ncbi:MAG: aminotransferase class I/II-fold pyridoxal phosphate-dependent enzyme, partial [Planctomycetes bacterium]|nr:aminotransferase class I/II-fold pyridoxal phosphate-dependent enzyme [Planctomycetota bacterium]